MIKITNLFPEKIKPGVNIFTGISGISIDNIRKFIHRETVKIRGEFLSALPLGWDNSRKLYRSFRIDPTRYRPSSEALWRRIKRGDPLPEINPFVDLTNFLSLKYQIPFGLYDIRKLNGDIVLIRGEEDMWYEGIRKERVSLKGKIVLADRTGPFGNPSSDSLRASTGNDSRDILQVLFFDPGQEDSPGILQSSAALFGKFMQPSDIHSYFVN